MRRKSVNVLRAAVLGVGLLSLILTVAGCGDTDAGPPDIANAESAVGPETREVAILGPWGEVPRAEAPGGLTVSGPYAVANLGVYLLHSEARDDREFLTLDQAMSSGEVTVSERARASVRELLIENNSDHPIFLQEGDRLVGGRQDRTVYASLVIPPHSGQTTIPTFCVEQGRWTPAGGNVEFATAESGALAPRTVRLAAKMKKNQTEVWQEVGEYRENTSLVLADAADATLDEEVATTLQALGYSGGGSASVGGSYRPAGSAGTGRGGPTGERRQAAAEALVDLRATTSLTAAMERPELRERCELYEEPLAELAEAHPDAVGVAFALDGRITEVDVYPGHPLFLQVYPRLLRSYALEAGLKPTDAFEAPDVSAVVAFLDLAHAEHLRDEAIDGSNHLRIQDLGNRYRALSTWEGQTVQLQVLAR